MITGMTTRKQGYITDAWVVVLDQGNTYLYRCYLVMKHGVANVVRCMSEPKNPQGATKTFSQHFLWFCLYYCS